MKKKILFVNTVCGFGSTGRIVADLSKSEEYEALVCFGRKKDYAGVNSFKITNLFENVLYFFDEFLFNNSLKGPKLPTKRLIKKIKEFNPDIIHLHNLHGYYLNFELLFKFLKEYKKPVIWTLHDCWAYTGYCCCYDYIKCDSFLSGCKNCHHDFSYPFSLFKQKAFKNYLRKKELINDINDLTIITPSNWLKNEAKKGFLKDKNIVVINNGIDLNDFKPTYKKNEKFSVVFVANIWTKQKGLEEINKIVELLDDDIEINVIGTIAKKDVLNKRCHQFGRFDNYKELLNEVSKNHLFLNPTLQDNFPTVNIESLACGTPVITYNTGGSPETINDNNGVVVKDYKEMAEVVNRLKDHYVFDLDKIRESSLVYSKKNMLDKYDELYKITLNKEALK